MAADHDVFEHGHGLEQADVLEGAGQSLFGDAARLETVEPPGFATGRGEHQVAAGGGVDAGQAVEKGGLAGAVGADQGHDLTMADAQVQVVQGADAAEIHGQAADFEQRRHGVCQSCHSQRPGV